MPSSDALLNLRSAMLVRDLREAQYDLAKSGDYAYARHIAGEVQAEMQRVAGQYLGCPVRAHSAAGRLIIALACDAACLPPDTKLHDTLQRLVRQGGPAPDIDLRLLRAAGLQLPDTKASAEVLARPSNTYFIEVWDQDGNRWSGTASGPSADGAARKFARKERIFPNGLDLEIDPWRAEQAETGQWFGNVSPHDNSEDWASYRRALR